MLPNKEERKVVSLREDFLKKLNEEIKQTSYNQFNESDVRDAVLGLKKDLLNPVIIPGDNTRDIIKIYFDKWFGEQVKK
jgi:hypothetical protein